MELVQELFMTAFVAVIFSFFLAKLVSIATSRGTEPDVGLITPSDNVREESVVEEATFDGGLRVKISKSNRKVRFADESVQKVDKFEAVEEKRDRSVVIGDAAEPIEVVDAVTNLVGLVVEGKKVEEIENESGVKNEGKIATADLALEEEILDELKQERAVDELEQPCCSTGFDEKLGDSALICDSEGRVKVVEVIGELSVEMIGGLSVDSSAEQLRPEAADIGCTGVDMIKEEGIVGNLDGLVVEEGSKGTKVDDVEKVSIKEKDGILTNLEGDVDVIEEVRVNLDGLAVEEGCKGKKVDDVERVSIKEEGVVANLDGLVVDEDCLVVEEGSEGKEVDDVESVIKEDDAVTSLEGGERKVVDDVESVINEGNEEEDADDIEKRCEGVRSDDTGNEIKEEGLVTDMDGLVDEEGGKEVHDVESVTKERNPMEDLVFEGKLMENADADKGDVVSVIQEGNVRTDLVFEKIMENVNADVGNVVSVIQEGNPMAEKIVEHVDEACKVDMGSTIDDIVVAQDAKVSDMESGIEQGLNTGVVKEEEPVGDEEDDWEGIERSDLDEAFAAAAKYVAGGGKDERLSNMGSDVQMQLYGLHKVAMEGPCHEPQPMALKISSRAKWNAWQRMGNMDPEVAMEQYIALLSDKVPGWMEGKSPGDDNADSLESGVPAAPHSDRSTDPYGQHNSTKKRELEDSGADGGV